MSSEKPLDESKLPVTEVDVQLRPEPGSGGSGPVETKEREVMSLEQSHQVMLRRQEARNIGRTPQLQLFEAYDAAEDVGTVRLLWLEAALKARRVPESEG